MSSHHDDHHSTEQKPVSFTVPFFLAVAAILAVVLFLSLCDPKPHHSEAGGHGHESTATEASHSAAGTEEQHSAAKVEGTDSMTVETTVPTTEAGKEHH